MKHREAIDFREDVLRHFPSSCKGIKTLEDWMFFDTPRSKSGLVGELLIQWVLGGPERYTLYGADLGEHYSDFDGYDRESKKRDQIKTLTPYFKHNDFTVITQTDYGNDISDRIDRADRVFIVQPPVFYEDETIIRLIPDHARTENYRVIRETGNRSYSIDNTRPLYRVSGPRAQFMYRLANEARDIEWIKNNDFFFKKSEEYKRICKPRINEVIR